MIFSSLEFVCVFLPVVFLLYSIIPNLKARNALLILASLVFYAFGEPVYVLLMLFSVALNYLTARLIAGFRKHSRAILSISVVLNLGLLAFFKYSAFAVESVNSLLNTSIPVPEVSLPIGISFFTFQAMSYIIDVYRERVDVQKNPFYLLLYISFFPQLIAGPIVKYKDVCEAITSRRQDINQITEGIWRFIVGLGKKVLIANTLGSVADTIFDSDPSSVNAAVAWLGAIAYMLQIYYDFSGYSDMAIGLGHMFGFSFNENFIYPYGSRRIKEFWRRWHISLSSWFKDYLYIPLGGNRKGRARACVNKIIVFFLTGLWHGAGFTFILWGLWHGLFLLLEEYLPRLRRLPRALGSIYTLLVVCIGFVMFRADSVSQGFRLIKSMLTDFSFSSSSTSLLVSQLTPFFIVMLVIGIIGCAPIRPLADKIRTLAYSSGSKADTSDEAAPTEGVKARSAIRVLLCFASLLVLSWCILRLSANTYNPFIYSRF